MKFSGRLADFSLPDVLRILIQSQKVGYLLITLRNEENFIYVNQGNLHHADSDGLQGDRAVYHLLTYDPAAEFEFVESETLPERTIQSDLDTLIQNGIDYLENWRKLERQYPRFSAHCEVQAVPGAQADNSASEHILRLLPPEGLRLQQLAERVPEDLLTLADTLNQMEQAGQLLVIGEERLELRRFFLEMANTLYSEFESISGLKLKQDIAGRLHKLAEEKNWNIDLHNGRIVGDKIYTDTIEAQKLQYGEYLRQMIGLISPIYGTTFIQQVLAKVEKRLTGPVDHWVEELKLEV
jgi:hypothetical protein